MERKKIIAFLSGKSALLLLFVTIYLLFFAVFLFRNDDLAYFFLTLEIGLFLLVTALFFLYVSYRKELTLREKNQLLEEENEKLKEESIRTQKDLEDYFALWLHQMKTPITVTKLLLDHPESDRENRRLKVELAAIEEYTSMALNYIRILQKGTPLDLAYVSLDDIVKTVLKKYSYLFISKHISLQYETINAAVLTDSKWLEILLEQFLSNATKYTDHGEIEIRYNPGQNCLSIRDSGIGIRSEDIPLIFTKGYSGFNGRANQKSSGLGLFLAKEIAQKLAIRIEVHSVLGEGSTFSLYLSKL